MAKNVVNRVTFVYMNDKYTMTVERMSRFFGVGYDKINKQLREGLHPQTIAEQCAERGNHKPRSDIMFRRFSGRRLVP